MIGVKAIESIITLKIALKLYTFFSTYKKIAQTIMQSARLLSQSDLTSFIH